MAETAISRSIADSLEGLGYIVVRLQSGKVRVRGGWMQGNREGAPDRGVLVGGGRVCWLEVKDQTAERLSQKKWRERAEKLGHVVAIVKSVGEAVAAVRAAEGRQG